MSISKTRITCDRRLEWDAAHRVTRHESRCRTLHGHRYVAIVECESDGLDAAGRVVDFGVVKAKLGTWIDETLDHTTILAPWDSSLIEWCVDDQLTNGNRAPFIMPEHLGEPTAENIAALLLSKAAEMFDGDGLRVTRVRVFETPNCTATAEARL